MSNELLKVLTEEKLIEMGFIKEEDGSGDARGVDYNIRNDKFHLMVDPWCVVKLSRVNPDTDPITIQCDTLFELESIVDFIKD